MELWVHHLCLFAGCAPAIAAPIDERSDVVDAVAETETVLEDA